MFLCCVRLKSVWAIKQINIYLCLWQKYFINYICNFCFDEYLQSSTFMCELLIVRHGERYFPLNKIANSAAEKLKLIQTSRGKHGNTKPEPETGFNVATPLRQVNNEIVYLVVKLSKNKHFALGERFYLLNTQVWFNSRYWLHCQSFLFEFKGF